MTINYKEVFKSNIRYLVDQELVTVESGHRVWWPTKTNGYFSADTLRYMADYLDELNAEWDAQIAKDVG